MFTVPTSLESIGLHILPTRNFSPTPSYLLTHIEMAHPWFSDTLSHYYSLFPANQPLHAQPLHAQPLHTQPCMPSPCKHSPVCPAPESITPACPDPVCPVPACPEPAFPVPACPAPICPTPACLAPACPPLHALWLSKVCCLMRSSGQPWEAELPELLLFMCMLKIT